MGILRLNERKNKTINQETKKKIQGLSICMLMHLDNSKCTVIDQMLVSVRLPVCREITVI